MINMFILILFFGVYCLMMVHKHILTCMISLELIVVYFLLVCYYFCYMSYCSMYLFVLLMTFLVCEGALGLSLVVYMIRFHSNDYLNSMMMW